MRAFRVKKGTSVWVVEIREGEAGSRAKVRGDVRVQVFGHDVMYFEEDVRVDPLGKMEPDREVAALVRYLSGASYYGFADQTWSTGGECIACVKAEKVEVV